MPRSSKSKRGTSRQARVETAGRRAGAAACARRCAAALLFPAAILAAGEAAAAGIRPADFASLHALMKPRAGEWAWMQVPWMPAGDIWAARRRAAREGKPLFLWYMAGEPLGRC